MRAPSIVKSGYSLQPRLRIFAGSQMVLGGGKVMLLKLIQETGSISEAARQMEISYAHATTLLKVMNEGFSSPLVIANKGGNARGGAQLTETGKEALEIYDAMVEESKKATQKSWEKLRGLLKPTVRSNLPKKAASSA